MQQIKAEVITIGDEILYGQITDTNTQWISAELDKIGIKTIRKSAVGDSREEILKILSESIERADIVLITGGLGPTKDDITKTTLAYFWGDKMIRNPEALRMVSAFFAQRNLPLSTSNEQQADLPESAIFLPNAMGTAPGMWFEKKNTVLVSMPGVPYEMQHLMEHEVLPRITQRFKTSKIIHKVFKTIGIGESFLAEIIDEWETSLPSSMKLAYLPDLYEVRLRITAIGKNEEQLENELTSQKQALYKLIGKYIYAEGDLNLEQTIGNLLLEQQATLATAESCTGGFVAHSLTINPGSSTYFMGAVVCYSNSLKIEQLGVGAETLDAFGAVSEQTVAEMAEGARKRLKSTYSIATSGIAGPDGGSPEKPVGTIWLAVSGPNKTVCKKILSTRSRLLNIKYASKVALDLLRKLILNEI